MLQETILNPILALTHNDVKMQVLYILTTDFLPRHKGNAVDKG